MCLCLSSVRVCVCVCHYSFVSPSEPRPFSPFVLTASEETRGPSRHEITNYTLKAVPRGLHTAQPSKTGGEQ